MPKYYILYDGRAMYKDTDDCTILEAVGNRFTKKDYQHWKDYDAVLVEYDIAEPRELVNERIVGHLSMGWQSIQEAIRV